MTDDLVKRLRAANAYKAPDFSIPFVEPIKAEAADRIEAFEQEVERRIEPEQVEKLIEMAEPILAEVYAAECAYRKEAEARLAKAVEALRFYAEGKWPEDYPGGVLHDVDGVTHIDYGHKATALLAEIEGKKDE